ncbi:MAG: FlgD immunoglobulin-like domain containing protein, partial [Cyclobacteriaceae bacterium]
GELNVQGGYNMVVKVMPSNPNSVLLGATNLYRSTDAFSTGNNIEWIGGYNPEDEGGNLYPNHHPDQHELLFFANSPNKVLSANDGGLQISNNILASNVQWISLNNGFVTSQFYTIKMPKTSHSPIIKGGLQDNGTQLTQSKALNPSWTQVLGGDGAFSASVPFNLHWFFSFQNSQIYRITFGEESSTFARVDPTGGAESTNSEYLFINPYVLDPINANIMYLAGGNAIWKNSNLAQIPNGSQKTTSLNWTFLQNTLTAGGQVSAIEISPLSRYLYYGTSEGQVLRLKSPSGLFPSPNIDITQANLPEGYVSCIASNPENDDEILVVYSNYGIPSIFHSVDAGETFTDVGGVGSNGLEEFADGSGNGPSIRWAEIIPTYGGMKYFVGTSVGLFSTDELSGSSTVWVKESSEMIGSSVIRMMDYRPLDGQLDVATHGNGVYRTIVADAKLIDPESIPTPFRFKVSKPFPNPFTEKTEIEFKVPLASYVRIDIYDTGGNFVKNLFYNVQFSGTNTVSWDGSNQQGYKVKPGMYFYRIYYGDKRESGRVVYTP